MAEIFIYDNIGPDSWGMVSAKYVMSELAKIKPADAVTVRINSPGGDVFEGQAIYNALKRRGNITVEIDALAASAASFIAMAGDTINIAENAMMMIHNAWAVTVGNKEEHQKRIGLLDQVDGIIADTYAARSSKSREELAAMMTEETWLTAKEAVDIGLATAIGQPLKVSACIKEGRYSKTPQHLLAEMLPNEQQRNLRTEQAILQLRLTKAKNS
jgi:ATP-dependent Clp protease protease subunit